MLFTKSFQYTYHISRDVVSSIIASSSSRLIQSLDSVAGCSCVKASPESQKETVSEDQACRCVHGKEESPSKFRQDEHKSKTRSTQFRPKTMNRST